MNIPKQLQDFRNFLYLVWKHLNLPDPTPIQYDIADYLQKPPHKRRRVIEAFRGIGKSYITSAYVCWRLLLNPDYKVLVVSASKTRSDDFSTFTQRLIEEVPMLQHLVANKDQRWSKISFDVAPAIASHSPSVKSVGITGQLTGSRADEIIADDIEVANNSDTHAKREKLSEAIKEFDAILKPNGLITYLGTPQSEQSIYNLLPDRGYEIRIWPARYPTEKQRVKYQNTLAPYIQDKLDRSRGDLGGEPTDVKRFDSEDLRERELSYGRSGFSLQFMLDTSLSDADKFPLKLSDLIVMPIDKNLAPEKVVWSRSEDNALQDLPNVGLYGDRYYKPINVETDWLPFQGAVLAIDPSGRGKDETAYAVVKILNSRMYLTRSGGVTGGYSEEALTELAKIAFEEKVNEVIIESNFGDGMFTELFKPYLRRFHPCGVQEVRNNKMKELRIIETLEPVLNQHRLVVCPSVIENDYKSVEKYDTDTKIKYTLFYQMTRITKDKGSLLNDDRLDALEMAVRYWVDSMGLDIEELIKERKAQLLDDELTRFMQNAVGNSFGGNKNTWYK